MIQLTVNSLESGRAGKAEIDADLFVILTETGFYLVGKDMAGVVRLRTTPENPGQC